MKSFKNVIIFPRQQPNLEVSLQKEVHSVLDRIKSFSESVRAAEFKGFTGKTLKNLVVIGIEQKPETSAKGEGDCAPQKFTTIRAHLKENQTNKIQHLI